MSSSKRPSSESSPGASTGPNHGSSGPNNKRVRRSQNRRPTDQPSIDSFFGSSRAITIPPAESLNSKLPASASKLRPRETSSTLDKASPVIIDVDRISDLEEDIQQIPATSSSP